MCVSGVHGMSSFRRQHDSTGSQPVVVPPSTPYIYNQKTNDTEIILVCAYNSNLAILIYPIIQGYMM